MAEGANYRLWKVGRRSESKADLDGAKVQDQKDLEITARLAAQDPGNRSWQFDLWLSNYRLGDVFDQKDLNGAKAQHQCALEIIQELVRQDPSNLVWQRALAISHDRQGNALKAQGDFTGAREQYASALAIC